MPEEHDPEKQCYRAGDRFYSIHKLLYCIADPAYTANGMPRISDYHLKVGEPLRYRIDSHLVQIPQGEILTEEVFKQLILPILTPDRREQLLCQKFVDMDCGYELTGDVTFNFRINVFRERHGLAAVLRLLPPEIPTLDSIGFPNDTAWEKLVSLNQGLVLVAGVTGSGKSTTIASFLNHINAGRAVRIITLEDPIEYLFKSKLAMISQREIGTHADSFAQGLRSALREDPDVIVVGEIRDAETASLAITAAETGHLVFSTVHTRDTTGAISRLIDMFPEDRNRDIASQLSLSLAAVISQKLITKKEDIGRLAAMEILYNIPAVANIIRTGKFHQLYSMMETHSNQGMITFEQSLLNLFNAGLITREQAVRYTNRAEIIDHLPPAAED